MHNLRQTQQLSAQHEPLGYPIIRVDIHFSELRKMGNLDILILQGKESFFPF